MFLNFIIFLIFIPTAPTIFSFFFNIVKQFLDEYTISKINLYNSNQSKWLPAILERVHPSVLPKYYGGEMTDPDGNPKCVGKICWGGKIIIFKHFQFLLNFFNFIF